MKVDYLVIGSGLTGATIARILKDSGKNVLVVDRRSHLGGNVHDHFHPSGIRVHTYGPHYFRTSSERIWEFVNRFSDFYKYEAIIQSIVDGQYENWPISGSYIRREIGENWKPSFRQVPTNFEEACLAIMPQKIYEKFVKGYTEKQWGILAKNLSADLVKRFDVHEDDDPRLKSNKYQGIPVNGYTTFMKNILEDIPLVLNFDYLNNRDFFQVDKLTIFTGPIDEFFGFDLGKLAYRGQKRKHIYKKDLDLEQHVGQVNNPSPDNGEHIRTLEWKHMMEKQYSQNIKGTVLTTETSFNPDNPNDYEYPFPNESNAQLYHSYRQKANKIPGILICGRLGEYKYYDMDQAIARSFILAKHILEN